MERQTLAPGSGGTATLTVREQDLASAIALEAGDDFPAVLATTRMIALMELAGGRALLPLLQPGEMSVGVTVEVAHTAPTPLGAAVTAEARFRGLEGKLYVFEVSARDPGGEIGRGTHKRAIVERARLLAGAEMRRGL